MATTWDEASKCPADGTTGKVESRKSLPRNQGGGQLVTLTCQQTRCQFHADGWIVQIRPDNTIPDAVKPEEREKRFMPTSLSHQRRRVVMDALEEQAQRELKPGSEIRG